VDRVGAHGVKLDARLAAFPVYGLAEQGAHPHFQAGGLMARPEHPRIGPMEGYAHLIKLSCTPGEVRGAAPMRGVHNNRVFRELLGLSCGEIERLRAEGVIV
jgi:formyl-CoA transferase